MGGLFSSKQSSTSKSEPWKTQQPYLKEGFEAGSGALDKGLGIANGVQDYTADLTGSQTDLLNRIMGYGTGTAGALSSTAMNTGLQALGSYGKFGANADAIYGAASQDATDSIVGNASKFADNPFLQGQIDAAISDVNKGFQRTRGDINASATATGNINSTRAGVLEAMAQDDAMDRAASISSTMRGAAYEQGLGMAADEHQQRIANMLGANGVLGDYGKTGYDMATGGLQTGAQGLQDALGAATVFQGQNQAEIEGQLTKAGTDLDLVARYMAAIGGNYGGTTTSTQTGGPGLVGGLLGAASIAGGLGWQPFCWVAREVYGEDDPRWMEFRQWLFLKSPDWLFNLYATKGERFSLVVRKYPILKLILRPLMDIARRSVKE